MNLQFKPKFKHGDVVKVASYVHSSIAKPNSHAIVWNPEAGYITAHGPYEFVTLLVVRRAKGVGVTCAMVRESEILSAGNGKPSKQVKEEFNRLKKAMNDLVAP